MSFWEDFKDLFKTKQKLEEEKSAKIADALKGESKITEQMKQLENLYQAGKEEDKDIDELFPTESGLKTVEYTAASDEELSDRAKNSLLGDYNDKKNKINSETNEKLDNLGVKLSETKQKEQTELNELKKKIEDAFSGVKTNAIKRGITRSSIFQNDLNDVNESGRQTEDEVTKKYRIAVDSLDAQIENLKETRENALNNLDVKYASDVKEKLADLTKERDAIVKKYEEYNNKIIEKQNRYALEREKAINDYLKEKQEQQELTEEYEKENGYSGDKRDNYEQRYKIAFDYYNALSSDIALDALNASPSMKYYLGIYYDKLKDALSSKQSKTKKYF
ncbi:MAG: hypothetical protein ACI4MT_02935 [Christensenellales bacterium]